jgi:hypothetical protein
MPIYHNGDLQYFPDQVYPEAPCGGMGSVLITHPESLGPGEHVCLVPMILPGMGDAGGPPAFGTDITAGSGNLGYNPPGDYANEVRAIKITTDNCSTLAALPLDSALNNGNQHSLMMYTSGYGGSYHLFNITVNGSSVTGTGKVWGQDYYDTLTGTISGSSINLTINEYSDPSFDPSSFAQNYPLTGTVCPNNLCPTYWGGSPGLYEGYNTNQPLTKFIILN